MNFKTSKPSQRLAWLADQLLRPSISAQFRQWNANKCVVGLGNRLDGRGVLRPQLTLSMSYAQFGEKFGVTYAEAEALYIANFSELKIRMQDMAMAHVTVEIAVRALRKLSAKYARRGQ